MEKILQGYEFQLHVVAIETNENIQIKLRGRSYRKVQWFIKHMLLVRSPFQNNDTAVFI